MVQNLLSTALAKVIVISFFVLIGFVIEAAAPINNFRLRDRVFNLVCGVFFHGAEMFSSICWALLLTPLSQHPLIPLPFSGSQEISAVFCLAFLWAVIRDFFYYWFHRLQHASKWLWAEHALHHSDEDVNVTTAVRHHWLEMPLYGFFVTAPMVLIFKPPIITIPFAYIVTSAVGYLIHCNVRINSGYFGWLLANPQNHRIHHSKQAEHIDKNFAQFFPLWDVLFGTYYQPKLGEFPDTGLMSGESVRSFRHAAVLPFVEWKAMLRRAD